MKTLNIPFIEGLEAMSPENIKVTLGAKGAHDILDNAPWTEFPYKPLVKIDVAATKKYLFVRFDVSGLGLKAEFAETNQPVWQDSCVEVFIGDADGMGYRNIEVNCIGTLLSSHQKSRGVEVMRISEREAESVIRLSSLPRETFSEIDGEHRWSVIIGIPFTLIGYETPPRRLRANFYKCANKSRWPHYLSWSRIDTPKPDFHRPEFFGELILEQAEF